MEKMHTFHFYPRLSNVKRWQKVATCLCCRISEASKAFQMEKIEHGYENMNHFTVNLNREEKIIREIDFYRGLLFLWPFGQSCRCVKAADGSIRRKGGFRITSRMDVNNYTRIIIQCETILLQIHIVGWQCLFGLVHHSAYYNGMIGHLTPVVKYLITDGDDDVSTSTLHKVLTSMMWSVIKCEVQDEIKIKCRQHLDRYCSTST